MKEYAERDAILLRMGFESYAAYLASNLWRSIRAKVLKANDGTCLLCGEKAEHVHHTEYSLATLQGKRTDTLYPLCSTCHGLAEFSETGKKRTLLEANRRLGLLRDSSSTSRESLIERRQRLLPSLFNRKQKKREHRAFVLESRKGWLGHCPQCGRKLCKTGCLKCNPPPPCSCGERALKDESHCRKCKLEILKKTLNWCSQCGQQARKGTNLCRRCLRESQGKSEVGPDSSYVIRRRL